MSNSQIITHSFSFIEPSSIEEAVSSLKEDNVKILSGGTDLLNRMKDGREKPARIVYVSRLKELSGISEGDYLTIGAAVSLSEIEKNPIVSKQFPALADAINSIGGKQIRNTGTVAGNLANASPGADSTPPLMAYGAEVVLASADGSGGVKERTVPVESFFTGPGKTVLDRGELIKQIRIPRPAEGTGGAFRKLARVTLDIAKINCSVVLRRKGKVCEDVRIVLGSVAPTAVRVCSVEKALIGVEIDEVTLKKAAELVDGDIAPIDDIRSSKKYRLQVAAVLVSDVFTEAWKRSGGEI